MSPVSAPYFDKAKSLRAGRRRQGNLSAVSRTEPRLDCRAVGTGSVGPIPTGGGEGSAQEHPHSPWSALVPSLEPTRVAYSEFASEGDPEVAIYSFPAGSVLVVF